MAGKDDFYLTKEEPNRSCFLAMRDLILKADKEIEEALKYGCPCFIYRGRVFCYLWKDKKTNEPYFLLVEGKRLNHPMLQAGDRKRMKVLKVSPTEDLPIETINAVLDSALELYKNGTIKTKKWDIK